VDALGGYRALPDGARAVAAVVFLAILVVVGWLERLQYQLRERESSRWWASNGRDVMNLFALGTMSLGLKVIGFSGPLAFGLAATFVILLAFVQGALEQRERAVLFSVLTAIVIGLPVLFAPAQLAVGYRAAVAFLFP
jgi:hypothetical protein